MPTLLLYNIQPVAYQYGMKPVIGDLKTNVHLPVIWFTVKVKEGWLVEDELQLPFRSLGLTSQQQK